MHPRRTALGSLAGVALVAAGLAAVWRASDLGRAASDLDRQWAAAKAEGVPTEYADLHCLTPPIPEAQNAAPVYGDAFATYRRFGAMQGIKADALIKAIPEGKAKPEDLEKLRAALRDVGPALALAREGSRKPGFSFDRPWERGVALTFPEYADAHNITRALVLRAMLAPDPAAAVDDLRTAARMRAHLGSEPVLIAALVGTAMETDVHGAVRFLARRGPDWAARLAPVLDGLGPLPGLRRSLTGEAVWGMHMDEELARLGPAAFSGMDGSSVPLTMRLGTLGPVREALKSRVVEYWRGVWARLPQDPSDVRAARAALRLPTAKSPSYAMLDFILPIFDGLADVNALSETNRRLTRMALAIDSGRTPTPEADPFGAGPLKARHDAKGWTLWSVGPDGVDQGGRPKAKEMDPAYDLVVAVPASGRP